MLHQGQRKKNLSTTFYVINNMSYNVYLSCVVDHIKYSRKIFPFTLMTEGSPQKIWNIIRASTKVSQ